MTQLVERPVAQETAAKPRLTQAQIEELKKSFAENGYVVIKNVVPRDKLAHMRARILEEYERGDADGTLFAGGGRGTGHLNCFPGEESRFVYAAVEDYGVVDLVKAIAPQSVRPPNVGCNLNLPGSVTQHWHMDRTFRNEFLIINIAVVNNTLENGATDVVPGTHKKFYRYWQFALHHSRKGSQRVTMEAGDVLVRVSNLWHRGMPNKTSSARPMLALTWEDGGSLRTDPYKQEDGKISFYPNWFRPTTLGRLRERVMVVAPITYSAYRVVHSLFSNHTY